MAFRKVLSGKSADFYCCCCYLFLPMHTGELTQLDERYARRVAYIASVTCEHNESPAQLTQWTMEFWAFIHFSALISAPRCAFKRFRGILTLSAEQLYGGPQQLQAFTNDYNGYPEYLEVLAGIKSKLISRCTYTGECVPHKLADCCCECVHVAKNHKSKESEGNQP